MGTPIEGGEVQGGNPEGAPPEAPGPNPAWNDVLSVLPEQFHSVVTPHFQKWDQSAQSRIEEVNGRLKEFEAFQPFIEHGIDPQELQNGLRLMYEINNNPQNVWNALGQAYGLTNGATAVTDNGEGEGEENPQLQDPRFGELREGLELVSKILLEEQQAKQDAQADAALDAELASLRQKHGDYDEGYVLAMMQNGMSGEAAVLQFQNLRNALLQNNPRPFAPNVMGGSQGGNGLPSQQIDPAKLSPKETRNAVIAMLQAGAQQQ